MSLWLFNFIRLHLTTPWPILFYAATWITLLSITEAVATFSLQVAFVSAISSLSSFSQKCKADGSIGMPLDVPGDILCFPAPRSAGFCGSDCSCFCLHCVSFRCMIKLAHMHHYMLLLVCAKLFFLVIKVGLCESTQRC
ncbi:hypothetical protein Lalb_Chr20g0113261 [Lupinus albus]|uniref:Uncharacterized protein n=1 Tax=Lupinus albus TaxID=3870 RepID=A0A6A4NB38_LUPAL|nr:hypothetical protein Lalb_Chr20g0113261 [Lupinus albus]